MLNAGFRKHLNSVHSNVEPLAQSSTAACSSSEPVARSSDADVWVDQVNPQNECSSSSVTPESSVSGLLNDPAKEVCASIVAKLQGSGISNTLVSSVVGDLEELTSEIRSQAQQKVISALPKTDPRVSVINECFEKSENPFTDLNTEWKRNEYFTQKWEVVEPIEITLGVRYDI